MFSHRVQERHGLPTQTSSSPPNEFRTPSRNRGFPRTAPRMLLHPGDSPTCPKRQRFECGFNTHRIHGAGRKMLTWLGYIDGIHGAPYIAAPWIRHGNMILQTRIHWHSQVQQWDIVGIIIVIRPLKSNWINISQTKLEQVCSNVHLFWMIFVATPKPNQSTESKVCLWFTVRSLYKKSDLAARQNHLFVDARADRCKALAMPLEKKTV